MPSNTDHRSVLLLGKSEKVVENTVAGLRELGYKAEGTTDFFSDMAERFDVARTDMVIFGGQVPPERNAELRTELAGYNPDVVFVQSLLGIPGVIIAQARGAFNGDDPNSPDAPSFNADSRVISFALSEPARVKVVAYWRISYTGPDPESDSLPLLDNDLSVGQHFVPIPDHIPTSFAFATVQLGAAFYAFSVATEQ